MERRQVKNSESAKLPGFDLPSGNIGAGKKFITVDKLAHAGTGADDQSIGQDQRKWFVADSLPGAANRMSQTQGLVLVSKTNVRQARQPTDRLGFLVAPALLQKALK